MRVGIVTEWFERGAAYVSRQIADSLEAEGHEVYIYARGEHRHLEQPMWRGKHVWEGKAVTAPFPKPVHKLDFEKWLRKSQLDLVLFNEQISLAPVIWTLLEGLPAVSYIDYYTEKTVQDFGLYSGLLCNTQRHYSVFSWHSGAFYVPWGTDTQLYSPSESVNRPLTFFHSAGWSPERKGTDILIRSFASHTLSNEVSRLVIHTQVSLHDLFPELRHTLEKLIRDNRLILRTETIPAPGLYHLGDVYVYPSRLDGIGLTLAEALSSGLRLITTDEEPMREFAQAPYSLLIDVYGHKKRSDGYFWPMAEPDLASLERQLEIAATQGISNEMRDEIRAYALANRDWTINARLLASHLQALVEAQVKKPGLVFRLRHNSLGVQQLLLRLLSRPIHYLVQFKVKLLCRPNR